MGAVLSQSLALGVGANGALVQIDNELVRLAEGVDHLEGRSDAFRADTPPGSLSFTLDNYDGRFTPDNTVGAVAAGYSTALTEGSEVSWERGGKLWHGTVRGFDPATSDWGLIRISCDDMLGGAARRTIARLASDVINVHTPYAWWPLDDPEGAAGALEIAGGPALEVGGDSTQVAFGVEGIPGISDGQVQINPGGLLSGRLQTLPFVGDSVGVWGVWVWAPSTGSGQMTLSFANYPSVDAVSISLGTFGGDCVAQMSGGLIRSGALERTDAHYLALAIDQVNSGGTTTLRATPYVDGVAFASPTTITSYASGSIATPAQATPNVLLQAHTVGPTRYSHLTATPTLIPFELLYKPLPAGYIGAIADVVPEVTLDTLPADLAQTTLAIDVGGESALDALNGYVLAEQGYIYTTTTGTLTSPTEKVVIRERTRPASSSITSANTFDALTELEDAPKFLRDLTDTVSSVTATGPLTGATYTDTSLYPRVARANASESLPLADALDLYTWATDRLDRGANLGLRIVSVSIDSITTPTDRTADLLALKQGDRIRVANIPSGPWGFTTWDGWIIGIGERYDAKHNIFDFLVTPVLPDPFILDTDGLAADGILTLTSSINSSVTSISVTSSGALFTTAGGDLPQSIRIGSEVMSVTAVSGASSPQTFTVTRGQVDPVTGLPTTAASHTAADAIEIADPALLGF